MITMYRHNAGAGYGFITPDGEKVSKRSNIWFYCNYFLDQLGLREFKAIENKIGLRVKYDVVKNPARPENVMAVLKEWKFSDASLITNYLEVKSSDNWGVITNYDNIVNKYGFIVPEG